MLYAILFVAILQSQSATSPASTLTAENLDKLRKIALSAPKATNLDAPVVTLLGLGREGEAISVKQFKADTALGRYVFTVPVKSGSQDVLFSFRDLSGATYTYRTDSSRTLRSAMVSDADGNRTVSNEDAQAGFESSLKAWNLIVPRVKFP